MRVERVHRPLHGNPIFSFSCLDLTPIPNLPSFVYADNRGTVVGFWGVVTRRMSSTWGPRRVAFGSNFIVRPSSRTTPASLQLAKSFLSGDQDLSLSDRQNEARQTIRTRFGRVRRVPRTTSGQ